MRLTAAQRLAIAVILDGDPTAAIALADEVSRTFCEGGIDATLPSLGDIFDGDIGNLYLSHLLARGIRTAKELLALTRTEARAKNITAELLHFVTRRLRQYNLDFAPEPREHLAKARAKASLLKSAEEQGLCVACLRAECVCGKPPETRVERLERIIGPAITPDTRDEGKYVAGSGVPIRCPVCGSLVPCGH